MTFDSPNHLLELLADLTRGNVRFIVAGGVAVVLHGVERMTLDIDLALEETPENLKRFLAVMSSLGLVPRGPVPAEILLDRNALDRMVDEKGALVLTFHHPDRPWLQIDVFLTPDASYRALQDSVLTVAVGEVSVDVVSARRLIEMKRRVHPLRGKDVADIAALEALENDE